MRKPLSVDQTDIVVAIGGENPEVTLDQQKCFADLPAASLSGCEVSHRVAGEVLSIPIYGELSEAQRNEVVAAIAEWLQRSRSGLPRSPAGSLPASLGTTES